MSLVIYGDDLSDDKDELLSLQPVESQSQSLTPKGPMPPPSNNDFSVIMNSRNQGTLVLHNSNTNEVSTVFTQRRDSGPRTCPHCGAELRKGSQGHDGHNSSDFIHSNYFKLLEDNIRSKLPSSLFTQGYYEKFFKEISLLGRGSRGSVFKVEHFLNGVELGVFALKKITIGEDPKWLYKVLKEVHMLVELSSNNGNLVNYNHVWLEVDSINEFGPKVPCAFILQQYCSGGNLEDFLLELKDPKLTIKQIKKYKIKKLKGRSLTNEEIFVIFLNIVKGVNELHQRHIIHRDLKPSNCLLADEYLTIPNLEPNLRKIPKVLIGDFGESQMEGEKRNASGSTGTIEYCAPEVIFEMKEFSKKSDSYSLGMILYFMCFSGLPYKNEVDIEQLKKEISARSIFGEIQREDLNDEFIELIRNLTNLDPEVRMDTNDLLNRLEQMGIDYEETIKKHKKLSISELDDEGNKPSFPGPRIEPIEKVDYFNYILSLTQLLILFYSTTIIHTPSLLYPLFLITGASLTQQNHTYKIIISILTIITLVIDST